MNKAEGKILALNRKARHQYDILETLEAGIVLAGTEVKSLRQGKADFKDSYAVIRDGEIYLLGMHIAPYEQGNRFNKDPDRSRKLLLRKAEIRRFHARVKQDGLTLVALSLYLKHGLVKVELGLARGKKLFDKREALKKKSAEAEMKRRLD